MPNMSYCRFHNTLIDLQDCADHLDDEDISDAEKRERERDLSHFADTLRLITKMTNNRTRVK